MRAKLATYWTLGLFSFLTVLPGGASAQTQQPGKGAPAAKAAPLPAAPVTPTAGIWVDDTGQGAIEILPCGDLLCGRIVWLKDPNAKDGRPQTDVLNPNAGQRQRPICGLQVIGNLKQQSNGSWDNGWIYDPKEGKSYDVAISLRAPDKLQVTGYLGVKFLSETFTWTRAPAELQRCAVAN
ncbi:DUF2147 domain-containing protein [Leptospira interrogans]